MYGLTLDVMVIGVIRKTVYAIYDMHKTQEKALRKLEDIEDMIVELVESSSSTFSALRLYLYACLTCSNRARFIF